jgi:hypothetical protein
MSKSMMAKIKDLEARVNKPCENCRTLAGLNANQAKTIAELQAEVERLKEELAYAYKGATMGGRR